MEGVAYVAFGRNANHEARLSIQTLRHKNSYPLAAVGDDKLPGCEKISWEFPSHVNTNQKKARWAKVTLAEWSPFDKTLFLDADTRVRKEVSVGFRVLDAGWDLVLVPSQQYVGRQPLWNLTRREREYTFRVLGNMNPLMLNSGVMYFNKTERLTGFFKTWREEWLRFADKDQGALLRALDRNPVAIWLLGYPYNGGEVIEHLFGKAAG